MVHIDFEGDLVGGRSDAKTLLGALKRILGFVGGHSMNQLRVLSHGTALEPERFEEADGTQIVGVDGRPDERRFPVLAQMLDQGGQRFASVAGAPSFAEYDTRNVGRPIAQERCLDVADVTAFGGRVDSPIEPIVTPVGRYETGQPAVTPAKGRDARRGAFADELIERGVPQTLEQGVRVRLLQGLESEPLAL